MLDAYLRPAIDHPLNFLGKRLADQGISAHHMTFVGLFFGLLACLSIMSHLFTAALFFLALNRLCDGLDGAIARHSTLSDFGSILDIVCDFVVYAGIVLSFGVMDPGNRLPALFLLFSFIGPMASFLAYAIIAAKYQLSTEKRGKKSFYHAGGLCEGTETILVLSAMCLFPESFGLLCLAYGILCWITTIGRLHTAWQDFETTSKHKKTG